MGAESMLKPVVVTRAEERDGPLCAELRSLGLTVLVWAAVRVLPADAAALMRRWAARSRSTGSSSPAVTRWQP